jgi:DNA-binding response OmpR family regulator
MLQTKIASSKKILVVEDDSDFLNMLNVILGLEGYEVALLQDGKSILKKESILPDLYILDKTLPQVDGMDVCRFIKSDPRTKDIPVIMISGCPGFSEDALNAGATMFIEKPLKMYRFLNTVARTLQISTRNKWFSV